MRLYLAIIFLLLVACNSGKRQATMHLNKAIQAFEKKEYANASKEIDLAKKVDASDLEIKLWDSKIKNATNLYDESSKILKYLLSKKYKIDTVYYLMSINQFELGESLAYQKDDVKNGDIAYNMAVRYADSALINNTLYYEAFQEKIRALHNVGKYQDALLTINNAISLFPDSSNLYLLRGIEKSQLGDNDEALKDLTSSIQSKKIDSVGLATAYRFRSIIFFSKDSVDKAIDDLTIGITYDSEDKFLYERRANYFKVKGLKDKACADFRKAAELGLISVYEDIKNYCQKN